MTLERPDIKEDTPDFNKITQEMDKASQEMEKALENSDPVTRKEAWRRIKRTMLRLVWHTAYPMKSMDECPYR